MYQRIKLVPLAILALLLTALSLPASAQVLYSNLPWTDGGGPCIGANGANATGVAVRTPGGMFYSIESVRLSMHDVGETSNFDVRVYADNAGFWGAEVGAFGIQAGSGIVYDAYEFFPVAPIVLSPNTVYWIVATVPDEDAGCAVGWNNDGSTPTGVFSYVTAIQVTGGERNERDSGLTLEIFGVEAGGVPPVPGLGSWGLLLAILLLAASGGLLIRRHH